MVTRSIDSSNDINFGKGKSDYLKDSDEIKQNVKTRIQSWQNDCFFALDEGVDWNSYLQDSETELLANDIRRVIVQTLGVAQLLSFDFELIDRQFRAEYRIVDTFSKTWTDTVESITL